MTTRMVFVSRRLQCGAAIVIVMFVTFMTGVAVVGVWPVPEEPQKVFKEYNRLAWLSRSLNKMALELRELDEHLARNWTAVRLEDRMRLQREVNALDREYMDAAGNYNQSMQSMRETGYNFSDPAELPPDAEFGPLPRRHEPFILLKSGPRA